MASGIVKKQRRSLARVCLITAPSLPGPAIVGDDGTSRA